MPKLKKEIVMFYMCNASESEEYMGLRYDMLTNIIYAKITMNSDGSLSPVTGYDPSPLIQYAHNRNVKVVPMLSMGANIDVIFANQSGKRTTLINNILNEIVTKNFDGINIDMSGNINKINSVTGGLNKPLITDFITELRNSLLSNNPNHHMSVDFYIYYSGIAERYDIAALQNMVDHVVVTGYDYYTGSAPTAGPNGPISTGDQRGISEYIDIYKNNINKDKIILGIPWYGYDFTTADNTRLSQRIGTTVYIGYEDWYYNINSYGRIWDSVWQTPWVAYNLSALLYNPGFELGRWKWNTSQTGTNHIYSHNEPGRIEGYSVAIEYPIRENGKEALWRQTPTIDPTKTYTLYAYMKLNNVVGTGARVQIHWRRADNSITRNDTITTQVGTSDWTKYESGNLIPPGDAAYATIVLQLYDASGKVWFDDIYFDSVPASAGKWHQIHYDDLESLGIKCDLVNSKELAGIGIWAANYGTGRSELWQLVQDKFGFTLGDSITNISTVSGIIETIPTGDLIFDVYYDSAWSQLGTIKTLDINGNAVSDPFKPPNAGNYFFRARYLGDDNYNSETSTEESLMVNKANPKITTSLTKSNIVIGESVIDNVSVNGVTILPTGSVIFEVSNDNALTWVQFGTIKNLDINGKATSDPYRPKKTSTYYFRAKYSGDSNYNLQISGDKDEQLIVNKKTPRVTISFSKV